MSSDLKVQADGRHPRGLGSDGWRANVGNMASPGTPARLVTSSSIDDTHGALGEALRSVGALSAPPPPGFNPGPGNKSRLDSNTDHLWKPQSDSLHDDKGRTSSFTNLADVLGSGLAESMEDATRGEHKGGVLTDNFFFKPANDLSYARHTRHAASRLLGASPGRDSYAPSHKAPEAGSLFSFDSGDRGVSKKVGSNNSSLFGEFQPADRMRGDPTSNLAAAFSSSASADRVASYRSFQPKSSFDDNRLSTTKDLGLTVMEPSESFGQRSSTAKVGGLDGNFELQRDMQNLWSDRKDDLVEKAPSGDPSGVDLMMEAESDLRPFTWDVRHHDPSRALAIMRAASLSASDVRSVCESYGAVENFRSDFAERGVFFVSYYDMRCAQYAAMQLQQRLQKLGPTAERVLVQFCVPLNSSSQHDESLVVLMDVPMELNIDDLASMLSSYGAVRSLKSMGGNFGGNSFMVEYHDIQDAKQAVLELESTQQFGPNVSVEVGARNPADRKRGRELLSLIGRWRHGGGSPASNRSSGDVDVGRYSTRGMGPRPEYQVANQHHYDSRYERGGPSEPAPQLVLGPDGRYSYVVVNHSGYPSHGGMPPQYGERVVHAGHGNPSYVTHVNPASGHQYWQPQSHHISGSGSVVSQSSYAESHHSGHYPSGTRSLPYFADGASSVGSHSHKYSMPVPSSASTGDTDNRHLVLDLDAVENGRDTRTSLMVRNIPNKYTQQMLLNEFAENGHGPGIIDFFYLPIDFKNRCNRGYAFINFVDYRDILPFHRRYYGKHWRTFNSDKICDITYARIQGKSAMLKRFENSALMEKDDEYKPLVFVSHGADKGTRLPFPTPTGK